MAPLRTSPPWPYRPCAASMGPRSENRGYGRSGSLAETLGADRASMGPRSENRGYAGTVSIIAGDGATSGFNGSTVREPWLCRPGRRTRTTAGCASMGPRSENRGYVACCGVWERIEQRRFNGSTVREPWLCRNFRHVVQPGSGASMGPRSENRGYVRQVERPLDKHRPLQWVHGPRTVVMQTCQTTSGRRQVEASMGPRSENRGYEAVNGTYQRGWTRASMGPRSENRGYVETMKEPTGIVAELQWVHGPRTVVMCSASIVITVSVRASMGPRSENRGYDGESERAAPRGCQASMGPRSENRGYGGDSPRGVSSASRLQWVHGPRTVVMSSPAAGR